MKKIQNKLIELFQPLQACVDFIILYHISDLVWIFRAHCYHTLSLDSSSDR